MQEEEIPSLVPSIQIPTTTTFIETNSVSNNYEHASTAISISESCTPEWWHYFIAGELAGMIGSILCHPFDTAKTRVQMLTQHKQSTFAFMRSIIIKEGMHGLYAGIMYPFFGFGVLFSMSFGVNGICRNYFIQKNEEDIHRFDRTQLKANQLSMFQLMTGGVFAGAASSIFRTPIERVKTWSQIHQTSTTRSTVNYLF